MSFYRQLELFRDLRISKSELLDQAPGRSLGFSMDKLVLVKNSNVIFLLDNFRQKKIEIEELIDWVNIIWFSEWYEYFDSHNDCIAAIMNELEVFDEGKELTDDLVCFYLNALENNIDISKN